MSDSDRGSSSSTVSRADGSCFRVALLSHLSKLAGYDVARRGLRGDLVGRRRSQAASR